MAVVILRGVVVPDEVPAVDVVNIAVAVIVDTIARNLGGVHPNVASKIQVVVVHAGVNYGNNHIAAAAGELTVIGNILPTLRHLVGVMVYLFDVIGIAGNVHRRARHPGGHNIVIVHTFKALETG